MFSRRLRSPLSHTAIGFVFAVVAPAEIPVDFAARIQPIFQESCHGLKQRGMLDNTLVIWGGEFGRTQMVQGGSDGRDHHPNAFTMWMAGGGIKGGVTLGETDELGFNLVKDKVHVHDLHATMLHLLGFDHIKMTYKFQGRPFRLTDVSGNLIPQILA